MVYQRVILIISVLWINGCICHKAIVKKNTEPMTMLDVYAESTGQAKKDVTQFIEEHLKEQKTFGYVKPYIPVMNEPVVHKVWIPDHKSRDDSDVMIAGHWNYVMIQPPTWFIDNSLMDTQLPMIVPGAGINEKSTEGKKDYGYKNAPIREDI